MIKFNNTKYQKNIIIPQKFKLNYDIVIRLHSSNKNLEKKSFEQLCTSFHIFYMTLIFNS